MASVVAEQAAPATQVAQVVSGQDPNEGWGEKALRKLKENPVVVIGTVATVASFIMAGVEKNKGHSLRMNYWLRARVGFQGVTVVAILLGSPWGRNWMKETFDIGSGSLSPPKEVVDAEKKAQEKLEFEKRMQNAKEVSAQEEGLAEMRVVKGPLVNTKMTEEREAKEAQQASKFANVQGKVLDAVKKSSGWLTWRKDSSDSEPKDAKGGSDSPKADPPKAP